jgi:hypothetical protein
VATNLVVSYIKFQLTVGTLAWTADIYYLQRYTRCSQRERRDWSGSCCRDLESDAHWCDVAADDRRDRARVVEAAMSGPGSVDELCPRGEIAVVNEVVDPVVMVDVSGYDAT